MNAALPIPAIWTTGSTASIRTGTWRAALARHIQAPSPCHVACPVGGAIAEWIGQARARDWRGAWDTLTRHNPFPAIAGRICHHPCESACNRSGYDDALAICKLERFVGDAALDAGWQFAPPAHQRSTHVAVVGGGPAGLSAAFQLRQRGHRVTVFEAQPELGGLMRYGIPAYRLARAVLDGEIARIVALGVQVRCGQPLATADDLARLRGSHDAVVVAVGARRSKRLPQLDYRREWVVDGADYLARSSVGAAPALGPRVMVIGGGSAALDVARSARRAGHAVTILALEPEARLPAQREEVVEAREEGIVLCDGAMLCSVEERPQADDIRRPPPEGVRKLGSGPSFSQTAAGLRLRLHCVRVDFVAGALRGQFTAAPIDGSEFTLDADAVVSSIGQDPDLVPLAALASDGALLQIDAHGATGMAGVWAGGDVASMARFVTEAVGMGERAALAIHRQLCGDAPAVADSEAVVTLAHINLHYHQRRARPAGLRLAPAQRLAHDGEVQLGLDIAQALAETVRCFSCGTCTHCDNCVDYCPDLAVQPAGGGYTVLTDYCKGCGLCVKECPTGSLKMQEELR